MLRAEAKSPNVDRINTCPVRERGGLRALCSTVGPICGASPGLIKTYELERLPCRHLYFFLVAGQVGINHRRLHSSASGRTSMLAAGESTFMQEEFVHALSQPQPPARVIEEQVLLPLGMTRGSSVPAHGARRNRATRLQSSPGFIFHTSAMVLADLATLPLQSQRKKMRMYHAAAHFYASQPTVQAL